MSAPSINESLTEDHDRLDDLLESFQEWKAKDLGKAKVIDRQLRQDR
jgi:hypothetical protein